MPATAGPTLRAIDERGRQRDESIEVLEQKAKVLRHVADVAHHIAADPASRARGEDLELQAESDLGATESAIQALEVHRANTSR